MTKPDFAVLEGLDCFQKIPEDLREKMKARASLNVGDTDHNGNVIVAPKNRKEWFKTEEEEEWWDQYTDDRHNRDNLDLMKELFERGATKDQALKTLADLKKKALN